MSLPMAFDYPVMEATTAGEIPTGENWQYEPKWDGFRCLAFRDGDTVELRSKSNQPLGRYFPELVAALQALKPRHFVLDGEIAIQIKGELCFDDLLMRIHPAESRIRKLAAETPATYYVFDLLVDDHNHLLSDRPLKDRRPLLENFAESYFEGSIQLSPATSSIAAARRWLRTSGGPLDGVVAKRLNLPYQSGLRTGMVKIKNLRSADCVVGGFRYGEGAKTVGSLLLGLYDDEGLLHHVGFCSGIKAVEQSRADQNPGKAHSAAGFHGTRARRSQPLVHRTLRRMAAPQTRTRGRDPIRPFHRRPLPPRHPSAALASRQAAPPVQHESGHSARGFDSTITVFVGNGMSMFSFTSRL